MEVEGFTKQQIFDTMVKLINDQKAESTAALAEQKAEAIAAMAEHKREMLDLHHITMAALGEIREKLGTITARLDTGDPKRTAPSTAASSPPLTPREHEACPDGLGDDKSTRAKDHDTSGVYVPPPARDGGASCSIRHKLPLLAGVSGAFLLSLGIPAPFILRWKRRNAMMKTTRQQPKKAETIIFRGELLEDELEQGAAGPRRFSYDELAAATDNFSDDGSLGRGGFGSVYQGFLSNMNREVAVKKVSETSRQGWKEFVSEVSIISRLRHRNLVQLIGWCHGGDELLLVYELMHNGSLDTHLYKPDCVLAWPVRYEIMLGVGSALLYLHQETEQRVVHRDIKPSNIMLDASFTAKLGDFGLARLINDGHTTGMAGTLGYIDPESVLAGRASVESDVYSFGVLLLEVACGRRPAVVQENGEVVHLVQWVWDLYGGGGILGAADKRLRGEFDGQEMEHVLVVGLLCAQPDRGMRPSIRQAVNLLLFEAPLPSLPARMPVATYGPPANPSSFGTLLLSSANGR